MKTPTNRIRIGTRISHPSEVRLWKVDLLQISVYYGKQDNFDRIKKCSHACMQQGIRYALHPVMYSLMDKSMFSDLKTMAKWSDLALILHDEKIKHRQRLEGQNRRDFKGLLGKLETLCPVSFENATDSGDVIWFWKNFAHSITLDIGHLELAGMNSVEFVKSLDQQLVERIRYVHMHRQNGWRRGLTDHWYLTPDCREVQALKELLKRTRDIAIFLEINETEKIPDSLQILRNVRDEFTA